MNLNHTKKILCALALLLFCQQPCSAVSVVFYVKNDTYVYRYNKARTKSPVKKGVQVRVVKPSQNGWCLIQDPSGKEWTIKASDLQSAKDYQSAKAKEEKARLAKEQAEKERIAKQKAEKARLAKAKQEAEDLRLAERAVSDVLEKDDANQLKALFEKGLRIDYFDSSAKCGLMGLACKANALECLKLIHQKGGSVDGHPKSLMSPLMHAVGQSRVLAYLVENKARIDYAGSSMQMTPLWFAVAAKEMESSIYLIEHGANIEAKATVLPDAKSDDGTPLILASRMGNVEMVQMLLSKGARLEALGGEGQTALFQAVKRGNTEVVKVLIKAGAKLNFAEPSGVSCVMAAAQLGHVAVAKLLVEAGADINQLCEVGTALGFAAQLGQVEMVGYLIDAGADVNLQGIDGSTALINAVLHEEVGIVQLLLEAKANTQLKIIYKGDEYTALQIAKLLKNATLIKLLSETGASRRVF